MLTLNPTNRGTLDDVWQHPWVNMGQEEPLPPACEEYPGETVGMILGQCRDQIQDLDISSGSNMNEPKLRARTIIVRPAFPLTSAAKNICLPPALRCPCLFLPGFGRPFSSRRTRSQGRRPESLPRPTLSGSEDCHSQPRLLHSQHPG